MIVSTLVVSFIAFSHALTLINCKKLNNFKCLSISLCMCACVYVQVFKNYILAFILLTKKKKK